MRGLRVIQLFFIYTIMSLFLYPIQCGEYYANGTLNVSWVQFNDTELECK